MERALWYGGTPGAIEAFCHTALIGEMLDAEPGSLPNSKRFKMSLRDSWFCACRSLQSEISPNQSQKYP